MNLWSLPKDRAIKKALLLAWERLEKVCEIAPDDGVDARYVTLYHRELPSLRAHIHLHGQRTGTYGIFLEYPHPVPGILETEDNLPLPRLLSCLTLHFDT